MNKKTLLAVEDEARMVELLEDAVADWNEANHDQNIVLEPLIANDLASAYNIIRQRKIDCALVDLRLPEDPDTPGTSADRGNQLTSDLLFKCGIPVAIVSGYSAEVEPELRQTGIIRTFTKAQHAYDEAISWITNHWDLMDTLKAVREKLEQSTSEVFARRIWPNWETMKDAFQGETDALVTAVSRQYASHTAEFLGADDDSTWHPYESYIVPSYLSKRAHTGDIFDFEDGRWIILTPQCDMANGKATNVLLASCKVGVDNWGEKKARVRDAQNHAQKEKHSKYFRDLVNQNIPQSRHFLPPIPGENEACLVDFQKLKTTSYEELSNLLANRKASLAPAFLSNLVQRFGAFMSRTGQPNIDVDHF
ncbi:response regulator [Ruegeria atlantica]|uniref:response regulator n=1 Tax=Ruegeria atlantica TaxID=81569 RepID=UPI0014819496|nr:response regulator [Ruegeria atlantica]